MSNFYLIGKSLLVARVNTTVSIYEDAFYGLVNLYNSRKAFLLGNLKKLDVDSVYVVNNYLHGFTK